MINSILKYFAYLRFLFKSLGRLRQRMYILMKFRKIHRSIICAHSEVELLRIADEILRSQVEGDIIEASVYKGGSTCKLSVVAKLTGRKLWACDSFKGLPEPSDVDKVHLHSEGEEEIYHKGDYLGTINEVRKNLEDYGEPNVVKLVPGWFKETLPKMRDKKFALVFIDVDLHESIVTCIENLWPPLQSGCKFFIHEAHHLLTINAFSDKTYWRKKFGIDAPEFIGAKKGLSRLEPHLGYIQK